MMQLVPLLQAQKAMHIAMAAQLDAMLVLLATAPEKPSEKTGDTDRCSHPAELRLRMPSMGHPDRWRCGQCRETFDS